MKTHIPPSIGYQQWGLMAGLFFILVVVGQVIQINLLWPTNDWGRFTDHATYFGKGIWLLLTQHSWTNIDNYFNTFAIRDVRNKMLLAAVGSFSISLLFSFILTITILWEPGGRKKIIKVNGPTLYKNASLKTGLKLRRLKNSQRSGIAVHPDVTLSKKEAEGNLFVFGQQGSGKSVVIKTVLEQIVSNGDVAVIYDEKREYTELFYDPIDTILIAPWDKRSAVWDISKDLRFEEDFELIANILVSDRAEDTTWSNGARAILAGILAVSSANGPSNWGWQQVVENLSLDTLSLRSALDRHYDRASRFVENESKTTHGFISTLMTDVAWLYSLDKAWADTGKSLFSIRDWLDGKEPKIKKIIVQAHPELKYVGAPLCNAMIGLMTKIATAKPDHGAAHIWLVLDELGNLPKNDSLKEWMSIGRSKGCRTLAGTQSISQLHKTYGEHDTDTLLNLFSTIIALRCGATGGVAEYAAKAFGEAIYERPTYSENQEQTASWQKETWRLVTPSDLVNLPQSTPQGVTGYITSSGWNAVYRLQWPYPKLNVIAKSHVAADWLLQRSSKPASTPPTTRNGRLKGN
ncbi:type IV secretory system conjugative DNA transfer family protein [Aeromonas sp. 75A]|uniref:type IV secretory system conjugative DNA transfer family protein n=1 Tax=unclassified Aeromonas TaxID=257493 RepID=UPI002E7B4408|nr:type IV secretion system DNA-binding domain-containing protein [Aeromonas sp. 43P]MEE1953583.1 type IV secretion system DNA-binding domain-containing protein [Aeromonas sp. 43P]